MPVDPSIYSQLRPAPSPLSQIGDALQIQGQLQEQKAKQQQMQAMQAVDQAMKEGLNQDGSVNRDAVSKALIKANAGHLLPAYQKSWTEADTAAALLREKRVEIAAKEQDLKGSLAAPVAAAGYDVGSFTHMTANAVAQGLMSKDDAAKAVAMGMSNPEAIKSLTNQWMSGSPKQSALATEAKTAAARELTANTGAAKTAAEMPGIAAKTAVEQQVAAGTQGGITPEQQARLKLEAQQRSISAGQLAVAQQREKREGAQSDVAPKLSPAGMDVAAENYAKTGQLPPMGMGKQGAAVRTAIINRAAELHPGLDLATNRATFGSDTQSLKKMQAQRDAIGAFEQTASKNIDIFLDTAGKIVDTGSPLANTLVRAASGKLLGSEDQAAYNAARQVAVNEIAKITTNPNLSGALSDNARHEVEAYNPNNATLGQTVRVMRLLKQDMANRTQSMDEQLATIKGRIGGKSSAGGLTVTAPNGKTYTFKSQADADAFREKAGIK